MPSDEQDVQKISLDFEEAIKEVVGENPSFPKYTTQLLNIANQNAQGTRPEVVGQMSELIQECPDRSYEGWREWYLEQHEDAIDNAVKRIKPMIENFREAIEQIDEDMIREWVKDLVLNKTAEGLIIQEAILKELGERRDEEWELAEPEDESKNIDGYIGGEPVSIKPESYKSKDPSVRDQIEEQIIYYKKTNKYLHIFVPQADRKE
jgi:hypothetical protein